MVLAEAPVKMRPVMHDVIVGARFITVNCVRRAIAEDREKRANRNSDRGHRQNVNPDRDAKRGRTCSCHRAAETRDDAHGNQKHRRPHTEPFNPSRQPRKRGFEIEQMCRMPVHPIADHRSAYDADGVDDGSPHRPKDGTVHDRKCVRDGKRRRSDQREDRGCDRHGDTRPNRANKIFDTGLIADYQCRKRKRKREQPKTGNAPA